MLLKAQSLEQKYQFLQQKIKAELVQAIALKELTDADTMLFLKVFSNVDNYWELRLFMGAFEDQFKFLKKVEYAVREIQKSEIESFLQAKFPELLGENPDLVMEIAKYAAQPNITLVDLLNKFNELKN